MTRRSIDRFVSCIGGLLVLATGPQAWAQADPHAGHQQAKPGAPAKPSADVSRELPPFIPPVTDEDRKAAFPDVECTPAKARRMMAKLASATATASQLVGNADSDTAMVGSGTIETAPIAVK